jgi:hypothetical protein
LKPALILILAFVGVKLLLMSVPPYLATIGSWIGQAWENGTSIKISPEASLIVVIATLILAVVLSITIPSKASYTGGKVAA